MDFQEGDTGQEKKALGDEVCENDGQFGGSGASGRGGNGSGSESSQKQFGSAGEEQLAKRKGAVVLDLLKQ
jgi:hypothetical protein